MFVSKTSVKCTRYNHNTCIPHLYMQQLYYPGQSVTGSIQVVLSEPKSYKYIAVELKGKGKVKWTETRTTGAGDEQATETIEYDEKEEFVDTSVVVWGNKDAPHATTFEAGTFDFPFQFSIPSKCPPTFKTDVGKIKYKLVGYISESGNKDHKVKTSLVISSLIDLNMQPSLSQSVEKLTVEDITTCCCFSAGETQIDFKMPRTGFCIAKDHIPVTVECRNGSSKVITVRIELVQKIVYEADHHRKYDNKTIQDFTHEIQASESDTKSFDFDLPSSIILGFSSKIINVTHKVRLWIDHSWNLSGIFEDAPISVPVVIGNVVLNEGVSQSTAAEAQACESANPATGEPTNPPPEGQSEAQV